MSTGHQQGEENSYKDFLLSLLCDWIPEDNECVISSEEEEKQEVNESNHDEVSAPTSTSTTRTPVLVALSSLESLAPDLSARILEHLSVQEIVTIVATLSRTMHKASQSSDLWHLKFQSRWNLRGEPQQQQQQQRHSSSSSSSSSPLISPSSTRFSIKDYYKAYRQAYENTNDLWITHWNIGMPCDGLSPGRCCIQEEPPPAETKFRWNQEDSKGDNNTLQQPHRLCPNCRILQYRQRYKDNKTVSSTSSPPPPTTTTINSLAQAIAAATNLRLQTSSSSSAEIQLSPYNPRSALRAFADASTLHRTISAQQYKSNSLYFLTDLLFFQVHHNRHELEELKHVSPQYQQYEQHQHQQQQAAMRSGTNSTSNNSEEALPPQPQYPSRSTTANQSQHNHGTTDSCHTAMHSWHVVQFTNPDYVRPLVWRIAIQRPDCFTVFPSEGFLQPGQTTTVVFGVKPLGSLMAHAMHQLNAHREGVNEFWASVYTEEAHLPAAPFLIDYHFTSVIPCRPEGKDNALQRRRRRRPRHPSPTNNSTVTHQHSLHGGSIGDASPWLLQQKAAGQNKRQALRSIYLSAHVNGNFPLHEFWRSTLVPFDLATRHKECGLVYCAPHLQELYPTVWSELENIHLECDEDSTASRHSYYRTESPCLKCKTRWGARMEELGQAHNLALLECQVFYQKRNETFRRMLHMLKDLVEEWKNHHPAKREDVDKDIDADARLLLQDQEPLRPFWTQQHQQILHAIHNRLVDVRGAPWLSHRQKQVLMQWEVVADELFCNASTGTMMNIETADDAAAAQADNLENDNDTKSPWRHAGVYRHPLCTDSVFGGGPPRCPQLAAALLSRDGKDEQRHNLWKDEPAYLEAFAHLAHSPGRFCLGPQEDPNHLLPRALHRNSRFGRRDGGFISDIFMDDPICGIQAALCVLHDPPSLLVHGIYDRIPYPGTLVRRPKLPVLPRLDASTLAEIYRGTHVVNLKRFLVSPGRVAYFQLQNTLDMEALVLVDSWCLESYETRSPQASSDGDASPVLTMYPWSLHTYLSNTPPPGVGRFPLCTIVADAGSRIQGNVGGSAMAFKIVGLVIETDTLSKESPTGKDRNMSMNLDGSLGSASVASIFQVDHPHVINEAAPNLNNRHPRHHQDDLPVARWRGPRALSLLWVLSAHLGWTVADNQGPASVFVDRRVLIGAQWFSISLMAAPLFWTLFARYAQWIPARPVDYTLEALPFDIDNEMRFLTEGECGWVAILLVFSWLFLGRWIERYTSRDFLRAMMEHMPFEDSTKKSFPSAFTARMSRWFQRKWDAACPLFLQRLVFTPQWNRRSRNDLLKHVAFWRSKDPREHRSFFRAVAGRGLKPFQGYDAQIDMGGESSTHKLLVGVVVALGSFSASSPHFFLNLLTVFSCSISLGLTMSLQSMETGRSDVNASNTGSILKALSLVTIVVLAFLVGQLVGSSGGVLFLAEFVVTSISLILGGAGTISASAMESWGTFFCLSMTAFWGYLVGRVAVMEGIIQKKSGYSSIVLCGALIVVLILWVAAFLAWKWEAPVQLVILRSFVANMTAAANGKYVAEGLQ